MLFVFHFQGKKYGGTGGETVVTSTRYMSSNWSNSGRIRYVSGVTIGDYVEAGGTDYNLFIDNCYNGASRMMRIG